MDQINLFFKQFHGMGAVGPTPERKDECKDKSVYSDLSLHYYKQARPRVQR